jgi:hypothetical protein
MMREPHGMIFPGYVWNAYHTKLRNSGQAEHPVSDSLQIAIFQEMQLKRVNRMDVCFG